MGWETFDRETFYRNNRDLQATMEVVKRRRNNSEKHIAWKVSKYGVISGPFSPVFVLNTGKYRPEITPYLDTFHAVTAVFQQLVYSTRES